MPKSKSSKESQIQETQQQAEKLRRLAPAVRMWFVCSESPNTVTAVAPLFVKNASTYTSYADAIVAAVIADEAGTTPSGFTIRPILHQYGVALLEYSGPYTEAVVDVINRASNAADIKQAV